MGIMVFLVLNFAGYSFWQGMQAKVALQKKTLTTELKRLEGLKSQVPLAAQYQDTLAQYLKRYDSFDTRDTYLTTFVQNAVERLNLKLSNNAPLAGEPVDPDKPAKFIKSAYGAEVSGDWKKVLEFIYGLQEPTEFRYVKSMILKTRKSDAHDGESELVCKFVIQKWWHPDSDQFLKDAERNALATQAPAAPAPKTPELSTPTEQPALPPVGNPNAPADTPTSATPGPNVQ